MADDVRVAAADAEIVRLPRHRLRDVVFTVTAAAVEGFDDAHARRRTERFDVRGHADAFAARVARHRDGAVSFARIDDGRERQMDVVEIECGAQCIADAEHEHVAVFGLDFARLQDRQVEFPREFAVIGLGVELPVFGQHEAVDRNVARPDPLAVVAHLRASIVGFDRVGVQIEDHAAW